MSIDITAFQDILYDLINPLFQPESVQTMTFSAETVTGNKINGKVNGMSINEIIFTTDHATTMGLLATELETFKSVKSAVVNGNVITVTSIQSWKAVFTDFLVTEGATQPIITIVETSTPIQLIWSDQAVRQPKPPYVTIKITSGPIQVGLDELKNESEDNFVSKGLRQLSLSIQAFGNNSFTIVSRIQDNLNIPDVQQAFKAQRVSVYNNPSITDLTEIVGTVFESRHLIELFIYTGIEVETPTVPIESAGISGDLKKPDGSSLPVDEFIVSI